jgi:hypothetical protein
MELDYDTHLMPSTKIKKEQGEDAAIEYLFNLLNLEQWGDYDKYSILKKMKGYYKKSNINNQIRIKEAFNLLVNQSNYTYKTEIFLLLAEIHSIEKDYEKAFLMTSGALGNINIEDSSYVNILQECFNSQSFYLSKKDISNKSDAANYLYYYLSAQLYNMGWYIASSRGMKKKDERIKNWEESIEDTDFPFEDNDTATKSFHVLTSENTNIIPSSQKFVKLVFVDFYNEFKKQDSNIEIINIVDTMVNNYIGELQNNIGE